MKEAEVQIYTSTEDRALAALHTTEENPVLNEHDIWRNKKQNKTKKTHLPLPGIEQRLFSYPAHILITTPTILYICF